MRVSAGSSVPASDLAPLDAGSDRTSLVGRTVDRYLILGEIASGGMATVYLGRLTRAVGFSRTMAIKRLHPALSRDAQFRSMFLDEARLASHLVHANIVPTLDVVEDGGELFIVMQFVPGESLSRVWRRLSERGDAAPAPIAVGLMVGALEGLHAAHTATAEDGKPLHVVHRDVSPHNVIVGSDGVARVLDFGIARAAGRAQNTRQGQLKGKTAYMAKEQLLGEPIDLRADVYAASVVLWELLTGQRLFDAADTPAVIVAVLEKVVPPPSEVVASVPHKLDAVVLRGLARDMDARPPTALALAAELRRATAPAGSSEIRVWLSTVLGDELAAQAARVERLEGLTDADLRRSTSSSLPHARPRAWKQTLAVGAAASLVAAIGGATCTTAAQRRPPKLEPLPSSVADRSPSPPSSPPASESSPPPPERGERTPAVGERGEPSAACPPGSTTHLPSKPPRVAHPPRSDCKPPYTIGQDGIRIAKPECI